jgi:hypothetical protein
MNKIAGIIHSIFGAVTKLFSKENLKKADAVAKQIKDLIQFTLPAVELIASLTPTRADDAIVGIIKRFMLETPIPEDGKFDPATVQGVLMSAARTVVRQNLSAAILEAGEKGLKIGNTYVKNETDIPDSVINAATNAVYAVLKNGMKEN